MNHSRTALAAVVATTAALAAPSASAGNGSNYVHLINGIDFFFKAPPPAGGPAGIWRCFPSDMLHAPTLSIAGPQAGTYATKVCALHLNLTASPGSVIRFPTIALSSSQGKCDFLTSAGAPNFGLFSAAGFGTFVAGPLTGNAGPVPSVNLLAGIANVTIPSPSVAPNILILLQLNLVVAFGQTIDVPVDESLVLWVQDDPNQTGAGTRQYWTGSADERSLCSSFSFLLSGSGTMQHAIPAEEWGIGFGTVDATLTTAIRAVGTGSVHGPSFGFNPGFDAGAGSRTISVSGLANEFLAFNVYDELGPSRRLAVANLSGFNPVAFSCSNRHPSFVPLATGGPGGPVFTTSLAEQPRSVGQIDALANSLLASAMWIAATNHATAPGANNSPYVAFPAANGGSNAGGNVQGFPLPIAGTPSLPGVELFFWSLNVDPTNTFLDPGAGAGHKLTNGYPVLFFP